MVINESNDKIKLELLCDVFESALPFHYDTLIDTIKVESNKDITGCSKVLGILEDTFFMPNGVSLNKRVYPEELWNNCLASESVKASLVNGSMLGMLEHPLVTANEINGIISSAHPVNTCMVTKSLSVKESNDPKYPKYGYGKAYVLDTPVGRLLDTLLKSTDEDGNCLIRPAVSSRGFGRGIRKDERGNEILDSKHYYLQTFDVTFSPGIPQARPRYVPVKEAVIESIEDKMTEVVKDMNESAKELAEHTKSTFVKLDDDIARIMLMKKLGLR